MGPATDAPRTAASPLCGWPPLSACTVSSYTYISTSSCNLLYRSSHNCWLVRYCPLPVGAKVAVIQKKHAPADLPLEPSPPNPACQRKLKSVGSWWVCALQHDAPTLQYVGPECQMDLILRRCSAWTDVPAIKPGSVTIAGPCLLQRCTRPRNQRCVNSTRQTSNP
jgi:hypothetical protein